MAKPIPLWLSRLKRSPIWLLFALAGALAFGLFEEALFDTLGWSGTISDWLNNMTLPEWLIDAATYFVDHLLPGFFLFFLTLSYIMLRAWFLSRRTIETAILELERRAREGEAIFENNLDRDEQIDGHRKQISKWQRSVYKQIEKLINHPTAEWWFDTHQEHVDLPEHGRSTDHKDHLAKLRFLLDKLDCLIDWNRTNSQSIPGTQERQIGTAYKSRGS